MSNRRDRRSVLRAGLACCSLGLAGCLDLVGEGGEDGNEAGGGSSDGTEPPNGTAPDPNGTDGNGTDTDGNSTDPDDDEPPEPDPEPVTSWPMQQYDAQNTGAVPAPSPAEVELDWQFDADHDIRSSPVVDDGTVYLGDRRGTIYAIENGSATWKTTVPDDRVDSTPAMYDDLLIVPLETTLQAFDRSSGEHQWTYPSEYGVGKITVADDAVFFGDTTSQVHAVEARSGILRWKMSSDVYQSSYDEPPAIHDGEVFIPRTGGAGSESWELSAIDIDNGMRRPLLRTSEYGLLTGVSIADETLFIGASDGVHAYDTAGSEVWHAPTERRVESGLAVTNELVVGMTTDGSDGTVLGLDRESGEIRWEITTRSSDNTGPVVCGNYTVWGVHGPDIESTVIAVDVTTGEIEWERTVEEFSGYHHWAVANGFLYAAGTAGFVSAYRIIG